MLRYNIRSLLFFIYLSLLLSLSLSLFFCAASNIAITRYFVDNSIRILAAPGYLCASFVRPLYEGDYLASDHFAKIEATIRQLLHFNFYPCFPLKLKRLITAHTEIHYRETILNWIFNDSFVVIIDDWLILRVLFFFFFTIVQQLMNLFNLENFRRII